MHRFAFRAMKMDNAQKCIHLSFRFTLALRFVWISKWNSYLTMLRCCIMTDWLQSRIAQPIIVMQHDIRRSCCNSHHHHHHHHWYETESTDLCIGMWSSSSTILCRLNTRQTNYFNGLLSSVHGPGRIPYTFVDINFKMCTISRITYILRASCDAVYQRIIRNSCTCLLV